jgi:hypothetical protein
MHISTTDTTQLLKTSPDPQVKSMAGDAGLVKSLTAVLNASLEMADSPPTNRVELATALGQKAVAITGAAGGVSNSAALQATSFAGTTMVETMKLAKSATSPGKAAFYVTLATANKVLAAADLAQLDKCKVAIASLAVTSVTGAAACYGTLGIGCMAGALAVAADIVDMRNKCYGAEAAAPGN